MCRIAGIFNYNCNAEVDGKRLITAKEATMLALYQIIIFSVSRGFTR